MRSSTKRAHTIGVEKTFLSIHVFTPAMLEIIKYYNGYVVITKIGIDGIFI